MQFDSGWRIRGRSEGGDFLKSWPDSLVAGVDSRLHLSRFGELAACTLLLEPLFFFLGSETLRNGFMEIKLFSANNANECRLEILSSEISFRRLKIVYSAKENC